MIICLPTPHNNDIGDNGEAMGLVSGPTVCKSEQPCQGKSGSYSRSGRVSEFSANIFLATPCK